MFTSKFQELDDQIENIKKRLMRDISEDLISIYEGQLKQLTSEKSNLSIELQRSPLDRFSDNNFGTALDKVFKILENPLIVWKNSEPTLKRNIVYMYFKELPPYDREKGFGTVKFNDEINVLRGLQNGNINMVEMAGIEPAY